MSTEILSERATGSSNRPRDTIECARCRNWWTGLLAAHCSNCHRTFTGVRGFNMHRRNGHCLNPTDIGLIPADKPWPGWSRPGTWTGPT